MLSQDVIEKFLNCYYELLQNATDEEKEIIDEKSYNLLDFLDEKIIIEEEV